MDPNDIKTLHETIGRINLRIKELLTETGYDLNHTDRNTRCPAEPMIPRASAKDCQPQPDGKPSGNNTGVSGLDPVKGQKHDDATIIKRVLYHARKSGEPDVAALFTIEDFGITFTELQEVASRTLSLTPEDDKVLRWIREAKLQDEDGNTEQATTGRV